MDSKNAEMNKEEIKIEEELQLIEQQMEVKRLEFEK